MRARQESMNNNRRDWAVFVLAIVVFQLLVNVTIVLDIPVARQVSCFIYLTLVPGTVLLRIFGTRGFDFVEKSLFSIGLSVAFVMFLGLVMNQIGLSFGFPAVLSTTSFLLATNFAVFFLCAVCYFLNRDMQWDKSKPNLSLPWVSTICLPLLAILGTTLVNFNGNSVILLLMIGIIALTILITSARARANWPFILLMITIAVLFHTSLISNYIVGYDVHSAYHAFKNTQNGGKWNSIINETDPIFTRTNQMLSATIFPAIYSNMLNLEGTWILKIVYPMIFALVVVGLYQLYQKCMEKKAAFVAAFFILADITFFAEIPGLPTQMIGEFFLVLLLLVVFHEENSLAKKITFFTIFSAGIIVSHYGISYIFMFLALFTWSVSFLRKIQHRIKIVYVTLFFVMAFFWYIYTSQSASFTSLLSMTQNIYTSFWSDLLNPQSREEQILMGVGMGEPATSTLHWLGRGFHYATQFFIVLGVASIVLKWKGSYRFDREYITMSLFMLIFVVFPLVAPSFNLLNMTRMYHVSLLFLAPFCIVGGNFFFSICSKLRQTFVPSILTLIVVASLFLFEIGFTYEITQDVSYSVPLSMYRMNRFMVYGRGYLCEGMDVFGAEWLRSNIFFTENTTIYGDIISIIKSPLTSYAAFPPDHMKVLSNVTSFNATYVYVYLRNFNTLDGKIFGQYGAATVWNTSDVRSLFEGLNKVYTNGGCEIFVSFNKTTP